MSPRRKHPEQDFQAELVKALQLILTDRTVFFAVPNGGARTKVEAKILKGQGVVAGVPDLIFIHDARAYGMELKAAKRGASKTQGDLHPKLKRAGMPVHIVRTIDEALASLDYWRIPTRIKHKAELRDVRAFAG